MEYNHIVPGRSSKDHDFVTKARSTVEKFIGEKLTGEPLDDPNASKNPRSIAAGKVGGKKGGAVRATRLTPEQRADIARAGANARWKKSS
jgi:hypothetical protein